MDKAFIASAQKEDFYIMDSKKWIVIALVMATAVGLIGCSQTEESGNEGADEKLALTISAVAFTTEPPDDNGEVVQALEEYTKTELSIEWIPNSNIDDKFNIMLASGSLPHLMYVPQKNAELC